MKKVLVIALIAASFAACNNSSDKSTDGTEAQRIADSTRVADSLKVVSDAAALETKRIADSTHVADSLKALGQ